MSIFVEKGIVSAKNYKKALVHQKCYGGDINEILISMNAVNIDKFIKTIDDFTK